MPNRETLIARLVQLWLKGHPHALIQQHLGLPLHTVVKYCDKLEIMRLNRSLG